MSNLIKIRDISSKYDISARTLRYYENMGLITSARDDTNAYGLYDEATDVQFIYDKVKETKTHRAITTHLTIKKRTYIPYKRMYVLFLSHFYVRRMPIWMKKE